MTRTAFESLGEHTHWCLTTLSRKIFFRKSWQKPPARVSADRLWVKTSGGEFECRQCDPNWPYTLGPLNLSTSSRRLRQGSNLIGCNQSWEKEHAS
jgi:hypothetical protein